MLEDFSSGAAWRETVEDRTDYRTLISDLHGSVRPSPARGGFQSAGGWSLDASEKGFRGKHGRRIINVVDRLGISVLLDWQPPRKIDTKRRLDAVPTALALARLAVNCNHEPIGTAAIAARCAELNAI